MRRLAKIVALSVVIAALALAAMIHFSPYGRHEGFPYRLMEHSVDIGVPADSAFRFLGNSDQARRWSVFVHHITPLNADSVPDGALGSRRRCFCRADESGRRWDETIVVVEPGVKRQLTLYGFHGFPVTARNLATEQLYKSLGPNRCRLTFTVFFMDSRPSAWEAMNMYLASYRIKKIFRGNMDNIKRLLEAGK